jgi:hypothetical protein
MRLMLLLLLLSPRAAAAQFVVGPRAEQLRALIPVAEFRDDQAVRIYDQASMPRCYQHAGGVHDVRYNISGETPETFLPHGQGGNWGVDFPWRRPGGVDGSPGVTHFSFVRLPGPCVWWRVPRADGTPRIVWRFPVDTLFGEVLLLADPDGAALPFELRIKERLPDRWQVRVFRPFPTVEHLRRALVQLGRQDLAGRLPPQAGPARVLADAHHHAPSLRSRAAEYLLPEMPPDVTRMLLHRFAFDEATGISFAAGRDAECFAPTSSQAFSVVPQHYQGTFLGSTDDSCRQCHRAAGLDGDLVDRRRPKQKYGDIPGSDEILSFHVFDPRCISRNGARLPPIVRDLPGVIEPYDRRRHADRDYTRLSP